jgi:acyl-CoA hydrolase
MPGRPVRESLTEYSEFALPNDANHLGNLLGGKVMHLVDITGAMAAMRHSRRPVVTVAVDHMTFLHPVQIGQLVLLRASVNRVFRTSLEVGVKVFMEDPIKGDVKHTSSAYLTYVALDASGTPVEIPAAIPETEAEQRRYREAGSRREHRLEQRTRPGRPSAARP